MILFFYVSESRLDKQQMGCLLGLKIEIMGFLFVFYTNNFLKNSTNGSNVNLTVLAKLLLLR